MPIGIKFGFLQCGGTDATTAEPPFKAEFRESKYSSVSSIIGIEENKLNAEEKATVFLPIIDFDDKWKV